MELLVTLGFIVAVAIAAPRFGYDSRVPMRSNEEELARLGVVWGAAMPLPLERQRNRVRHSAAQLLLALARWLNPEVRYRPGLSS